VLDEIVDEAIDKLVKSEKAEIHEACRKAVEDMNAEWGKMEKQGIIRPGEDLNKKEETDSVYRNAIMYARHRVYDQLEKDVRAAKANSSVAVDRMRMFLIEIRKPVPPVN
jgi:hypothetical protein